MTKKILNVVQYIFLIIASFISIFPIFWMIIASTNKSVDVTRGTLLPGTYFLENMKTLLAYISQRAEREYSALFCFL